MTIRLLPAEVVNRIAAGEVVERPAAALKELVENAIDAGARRIEILIRDGGRSLISVADDGCGMNADELALAVERHATSKLPGDDLENIATFGFRGEALPAIGAVARMTVTSRPRGEEGHAIAVEGGAKSEVRPAAAPFGTKVEVRDLFFATPARLKFLKSPSTETAHAIDAVNRLAMAHPRIAFALQAEERQRLRFDAEGGDEETARLSRLAAVMGRDFAANALAVAAEREGHRLTGFIGLPTLNRASAQMQFLFVRGRPVRDRLLLGAVRAAYRDFLAHDRHPMLALFLDLPPELVDVNVHPAKAEVRFRDAGLVRGLIVGALRHALAGAGHRAATTVAAGALAAFRPGTAGTPRGACLPRQLSEQAAAFQAPAGPAVSGNVALLDVPPAARVAGAAADAASPADYPLGAARAQLHGTYIVAETADGLVIVDQHAAHERLVYERMKGALEGGGVVRQALLIPEVVELEPEAAARIAARAGELARLGLIVEPFGPGAVVVREIPAALGEIDAGALVRDLADEASELGDAFALAERIAHVCADRACRASIRAGRRLMGAEMDALLRAMEATPHSGQCNHGRPTYVELKLADIEKLFGRR